MSIDTVIAWIKQTLPPQHADTELNASTPILEMQLLDSLQIMDLVFFLEERHGNKIALEELTAENFETPAAIAAMVDRAASATGTDP